MSKHKTFIGHFTIVLPLAFYFGQNENDQIDAIGAERGFASNDRMQPCPTLLFDTTVR